MNALLCRPVLLLIAGALVATYEGRALPAVADATIPSQKVMAKPTALLARLRGVLPPGWTVAWQPDLGAVEIARNEQVAVHDFLDNTSGMEVMVPPREALALTPTNSPRPNNPAPPPLATTGTVRWRFGLQIVELVAPADYAKTAAANAALWRQIQQKRQALLDQDVPWLVNISAGDEGHFAPRTPTEKTQVAEIDPLQKRVRDLPEYHFEGISLRWMQLYHGTPVEPAVATECDAVEKALKGALIRYNPANE